jgi:hypothetical protein
MMAFPIMELRDEQACYEFLLGVLHPRGLRCPVGHRVAAGQAPHMSDRAPVVDYIRVVKSYSSCVDLPRECPRCIWPGSYTWTTRGGSRGGTSGKSRR